MKREVALESKLQAWEMREKGGSTSTPGAKAAEWDQEYICVKVAVSGIIVLISMGLQNTGGLQIKRDKLKTLLEGRLQNSDFKALKKKLLTARADFYVRMGFSRTKAPLSPASKEKFPYMLMPFYDLHLLGFSGQEMCDAINVGLLRLRDQEQWDIFRDAACIFYFNNTLDGGLQITCDPDFGRNVFDIHSARVASSDASLIAAFAARAAKQSSENYMHVFQGYFSKAKIEDAHVLDSLRHAQESREKEKAILDLQIQQQEKQVAETGKIRADLQREYDAVQRLKREESQAAIARNATWAPKTADLPVRVSPVRQDRTAADPPVVVITTKRKRQSNAGVSKSVARTAAGRPKSRWETKKERLRRKRAELAGAKAAKDEAEKAAGGRKKHRRGGQ